MLKYTNKAAGALLSLTDGKNQTTRWDYDPYGHVTNKFDQAGTSVLRYLYDPEGRLTNRWAKAKGNTVYSYDSVGNLTNIDYPLQLLTVVAATNSYYRELSVLTLWPER